MSPPNWDDDFDFQDIEEPKTKKKAQQKKATNVYDDDDFFDDDKNDKLPTITKNNNTSSKQIPNKRNSAKRNPYAENMDLKSKVYEDIEDQEVYEEPIASNHSRLSPKKLSPKKISKQEQEDYYEDIDDIADNKNITSSKAIAKTDNKVPSEKQEDEYGNDDFEDAYGEDFEEIQIQQPKKNIPKPVIKAEEPKKKISTVLPSNRKQPPKPPSRSRQKTQVSKRNLTSVKPQKQGLVRQNSRQSLKSINSDKERAHSKARPPVNKMATNNSFVKQKYTSEVRKAFPEMNIQELPPEKISKMTDRIRAMMKRFNEQLNNLMHKNLLYLKPKKNEKSVTVESKMKVYEEQKKNNETMIQYMEKEFEKLCGREGELREEEYQLMTEKKIQEIKQQIKETQKNITKLKFQVKNQGNKLSKKGEDKRLAQQMHHLKTTLIQAKKDEEKHQEKITKLDEQTYELDGKISDVEYKITQIIDKARQKGIQLETKDQLVKKFQDIKKRVEASRNHRSKLENLLKTKSDIISHQKQQMKINIKNAELQIKNLYESIGHSHGQSVKVVEKAKSNPKVNQSIAVHLDEILKSLQQAQQIDAFSIRSESNRSQASQRPLKNSDIGNMQKSEPLIPKDDGKPNLMKKKPKGNQMPVEDKNSDGRIWKDQQQKQQIAKHQKPAEVKKVIEQEDKKKPFSLKRNKLASENKIPSTQLDNNKNQGQSIKLELPDNNIKKEDEDKKQEAPSLAGPRMMKFRRKNNNAEDKDASKNNSKQIIQPEKPAINNQVKNQGLSLNTAANEPQKKQQAPDIKPFVPKRFNLRNKLQQKKQESYVPSVQVNKVQQKKPEQKKPEEKKDQIKFNFGDVQDPYANKKSNSISKKEEPVRIQNKINQPEINNKILTQDKQQQDIKPKFTLRLRDRRKNNDSNDTGGYNPSGPSEKVLDKPQQASNPYAPKQKQNADQQPISNPYNPYAQQNADAPRKREREGPVKKSKPQFNAPKQKINIYEQAQQAEGLNQFVKEPVNEKNDILNQAYEPSYNTKQQKQPDLNDLLGLNNKKTNKNNDDLTDLLGGVGPTKKANKKNEFFDDMDF